MSMYTNRGTSQYILLTVWIILYSFHVIIFYTVILTHELFQYTILCFVYSELSLSVLYCTIVQNMYYF